MWTGLASPVADSVEMVFLSGVVWSRLVRKRLIFPWRVTFSGYFFRVVGVRRTMENDGKEEIAQDEFDGSVNAFCRAARAEGRALDFAGSPAKRCSVCGAIFTEADP